MADMNYFQLLIAFVSGSNVLAGIIFLYTALHIDSSEKRLYLYFSLMCFSLAVLLGVDAQLYYTATIVDTTFVLAKIAVTSGSTFLIFLSWFIAEYTGVKPRFFLRLVTVIYVVLIAANPFFEITVIDSQVHGMNPVQLSWGEVIYLPDLETSFWALPVFVLQLTLFAYFCVATILQFKRGDREQAVTLGIPVALCIIASIRDLLIDIFKNPDIFDAELLFFGITLAMSIRLSKKVIASVQIKKELVNNERRWRRLLENVHLLVVGLDRVGRVNYVNPYYLAVTGFDKADVMDKPFVDLVPEADRQEFRRFFTAAEPHEIQPYHQDAIFTRGKEQRLIDWSNVALYDRDGGFIGSLSIGGDVTEREQAFEEIEKLKDRLQEENIYLQEEIVLDHNHRNIIGKSDALKYALARVEQVAPTDTTVLIDGETGVGKELFARAVHHTSPRKGRPLVKVNCAAIPANLIESELFGHEKGAFTGADATRKGRFELAHNGTIFLDEIGELPLELQSKLLRVLEDGELERLGSNRTIKVDVRVIAATNRILKDEAAAGRFREDLFYRLDAYSITIPPLRKRTDDILPLVENLVDKFCRKMGKRIDKISKHTQDLLLKYPWPGNVRELRNVVERAVIATQGATLHLPDRLTVPSPDSTSGNGFDEQMTLEELERRHIVKILEHTGGKISGDDGAAVILGLHPNTLRFRMQKLGIKKKVS